jgi:hypothetical protein
MEHYQLCSTVHEDGLLHQDCYIEICMQSDDCLKVNGHWETWPEKKPPNQGGYSKIIPSQSNAHSRKRSAEIALENLKKKN